jgi:positive regulator of sigma E activity
MPTRLAEVIRVEADTIELRVDAACTDCSGCGGRCALLQSSESNLIQLPAPDPRSALTVGQRVALQLDHNALLRQAWQGYGLPLMGLLLGAAALQPLGNAAAALGAVSGTSIALVLSKRLKQSPLRLRPLGKHEGVGEQ